MAHGDIPPDGEPPRRHGILTLPRNTQGDVLIVFPSYRGPREGQLPGGGSHMDEPPHKTRRREFLAETGIDQPRTGALLVVDYTPRSARGSVEGLNLVFDGKSDPGRHPDHPARYPARPEEARTDRLQVRAARPPAGLLQRGPDSPDRGRPRGARRSARTPIPLLRRTRARARRGVWAVKKNVNPVESHPGHPLREDAYRPSDQAHMDAVLSRCSRTLTGAARTIGRPPVGDGCPEYRTFDRIAHARGMLDQVAVALADVRGVLATVDRNARGGPEPHADLPPAPDTDGPTLLTDHPAWTAHEDGTVSRLAVRGPAVWHIAWTGDRFISTCLEGGGSSPVTGRVDPRDLPDTAPALLTGALAMLGAVVLLPTTDIWDAITAAILSRGLEDEPARALYRRWAATYGSIHSTPADPMATVPAPGVVRDLGRAEFAALGAPHVAPALRAAASAWTPDRTRWASPPAGKLSSALRSIGGISPAQAAVTAAHITGDYSAHPPQDPSVRAGAVAAASADLRIPQDPLKFAAAWRSWGGTPAHRHALTAYALAQAHHDIRTRPGPGAPPSPDHARATTLPATGTRSAPQ